MKIKYPHDAVFIQHYTACKNLRKKDEELKYLFSHTATRSLSPNLASHLSRGKKCMMHQTSHSLELKSCFLKGYTICYALVASRTAVMEVNCTKMVFQPWKQHLNHTRRFMRECVALSSYINSLRVACCRRLCAIVAGRRAHLDSRDSIYIYTCIYDTHRDCLLHFLRAREWE